MGIETAILGAGVLGLGGSLIGGSMQADAATSAAETQASSANQANQLQYQMFQEQQALMQPWVQSGQSNLAKFNAAAAPGGSLDPNWRFSMQDWQNSPEYSVYAGARDAALQRSQDAIMAQSAASGTYGSGKVANALAQNMGQLYAQYDPLSLQQARSAAENARINEYNQFVGLSNPSGAQQVANYAGTYGQNAGQNLIGAGNALAAGQTGAANAWGNALTSGVNQATNAYGQYQGQQNFNNWLTAQQPQYPNYFNPTPYGPQTSAGGGTFYGNLP